MQETNLMGDEGNDEPDLSASRIRDNEMEYLGEDAPSCQGEDYSPQSHQSSHEDTEIDFI